MFIFKISLDHGLIGYSFLLLLYSEARCGYNTKIPQITIISCYTIIRFCRVFAFNFAIFLKFSLLTKRIIDQMITNGTGMEQPEIIGGIHVPKLLLFNKLYFIESKTNF